MHETDPDREGRELAEQNKSVGWVAGMLALAVAYFGWAFLAAEFFQDDPAGGGGTTDFWANSIDQLANFTSVLGYAYRERFWMLIAIPILELGVLGFWRILKNIEKGLA